MFDEALLCCLRQVQDVGRVMHRAELGSRTDGEGFRGSWTLDEGLLVARAVPERGTVAVDDAPAALIGVVPPFGVPASLARGPPSRTYQVPLLLSSRTPQCV